MPCTVVFLSFPGVSDASSQKKKKTSIWIILLVFIFLNITANSFENKWKINSYYASKKGTMWSMTIQFVIFLLDVYILIIKM